MLAYVFWHRSAPSVDRRLYEEALSDFHRALRADPPREFLECCSYRMTGAAWIAPDRPAYEDWYRVETSCALDWLDQAAVTAARRAPHDRVAGIVAGCAGGLYRPWHGEPESPRSGTCEWFSKPAGMSYGDLRELLSPLIASHGGSVWSRIMVLGPAPEFRYASAGPPVLPASLAPVVTRTTLVEPGPEARAVK